MFQSKVGLKGHKKSIFQDCIKIHYHFLSEII